MGKTTKEVLEILKKEYGLNINRTTILKYHKMGIINQEEKKGLGRAKGVIVIWNDKTALKCYFINLLKEKGITLDQFKKYSDLAQIKNPFELHRYEGGPFRALAAEDFTERVDIMKFYTIMGYLAAVELNVQSPSKYDTKVLIDEENLEKSKIEVILTEDASDKKVVFTETGAIVENMPD